MYTFTEHGQKPTFIPHTHNLTTESSTVFQSLSHYFNTSQEEKGRPKTLHYKKTTISCINAEDINTCKFLEERVSSIVVKCPLIVDIAATQARLPWIKAEA